MDDETKIYDNHTLNVKWLIAAAVVHTVQFSLLLDVSKNSISALARGFLIGLVALGK
mgnify:CR=1 FL=1